MSTFRNFEKEKARVEGHLSNVNFRITTREKELVELRRVRDALEQQLVTLKADAESTYCRRLLRLIWTGK